MTRLLQLRTPLYHARWALLCALIGLGVGGALRWRQRTIDATVGVPITVLVASQAIPARTIITAALVTTQEMPRRFAPPRSMTPNDTVVGLMTTAPVEAGEVLVTSRLVAPHQSGSLAAQLAPGQRALTIPVDPVRGVGGYVQAGDHVDCFANFEFGAQETIQGTTALLLQRVPVLAVGRAAVRNEAAGALQVPALSGSDASIVTLAVTPQEAQRLIFALDNGSLSLALHPLAENETAVHLAPATAAGVTGLTGLIKRKEYHGR